MRIPHPNKGVRSALVAIIMLLVINSGCSAKDKEPIQLIVKFKEFATEAQRNNLHNQVGAKKLRTVYGDANTEVVRVSGKDLANVVKTYQQSGLVKYAEKDTKVSVPPNEK